VSGVAALAEAAVARATKEEEGPGWLAWAEGQDELGRCKNFPRKMVQASNRVELVVPGSPLAQGLPAEEQQ
jgi:hypothetical protein